MKLLAVFSSRPSAAIAVAVLSSACTSLLGLDGNYAAEPVLAAGTGGKDDGVAGAHANGGADTTGSDADVAPAGGDGPGGAAGRRMDAGTAGKSGGGKSSGGTGAGGASGASAGGNPSNGGKAGSGGASGGAPGGNGGAATGGSAGSMPDGGAEPVCPTGTYRGNYSGMHRPSTGGTAVPVPIAGNIILHLAASSGNVTLTGTLIDPLDDTTGGVGATLSGTLDCAKGTGSATLSKAQVTTIVPPLVGLIEGSLDISVDAGGGLSGKFAIHEDIAPNLAVGSGTWSADRTGN